MLFADLFTVLSGIMPAQRVELFMEAYRCLQLQYGDIVEGKTIDLVNLTKDQDQFNRLSIVNEVTVQYLDDALSSFGVILNEKFKDGDHLKEILNLLRGLQELETYEDIQVMYDIFTQDNTNNEEKLAEALSEFTDCSTEDYLMIINKVQDSLIPRIVEVLENRLRENNTKNKSDDINPDEYINQGKALIKFIQDKRYIKVNQDVVKLLTTKPYHLSLQSVLRLYGNRIADDNLVESWVFVLLATRNNSIGELYNSWDKYFLDQSVLIDMRVKVEQLYNQYIDQQEDVK
nr:MAG TPA: hypothetical protein [Caudoviricetes sp.]